MTAPHDKAIEAALDAMQGGYCHPAAMRRAIAEFLRAWEPSDPVWEEFRQYIADNQPARAIRELKLQTADELDGGQS